MSTERKKVLVAVIPVTEDQKKLFEEQSKGGKFDCDFVYKREGLTAEDVADASAIIGNLPPSLLKDAKKIEWLHLNSAGADLYRNPSVLPADCLLTTATGAYSLTVSEHMLAMTLALVRRFNQYIGHQKERTWQARGNIISVEGSVVLVLGLGDIGGSYARKVKALGATVIGLRRHLGDKPDYLDELHTIDELDALLPRADIVAMILPGSPETNHIMDERRLRLMKKGAYLVNCGRGTAIDPEGLKKVLREGHLGGAALDVTEPEPLPENDELWSFGNVIITPHVAGFFYLAETYNRVVKIVGENLRAWTHGNPLRNVVKH